MFKKLYESLKKRFSDIKRAYSFRVEELKKGRARRDNSKSEYLRVALAYANNLGVEQRNFSELKKDVNSRFYDNFFRALMGRKLHQVEESEELGLRYDFNPGFRFVVADRDKYESSKKSLESLVSDKKESVSSFFGGSLSDYSAMYISSFRDDCFTNKLARISSDYSGSVKGVADCLASYVSGMDKEVVSPSLRSWKDRVSNLEDVVLSNNFSAKDRVALLEVKEALGKNKYLVKNRKEEYLRAVSLIDGAIARNNYV